MDSLIFVDANTIWHRRLAEALGSLLPTVALEPRAACLPRTGDPATGNEVTSFLPVGLPPGWASRTARFGQRTLARAVRRTALKLPGRTAVLLSSPAYVTLAGLLDDFDLVTYCADDYRSYAGWGGAERVAEAERTMMRAARLCVFVSHALRDRATVEYGLDHNNTLVSPSATEERFLAENAGGPPCAVPEQIAGLPRPIVGVLGALSRRLDVDLITRAANLDGLGTLLVAGLMSDDLGTAGADLLAHRKVHVTGRLPHGAMHIYARAMDAALIPYSSTSLNHYCSPMRLYDHLATGTPIFALDTCDQIVRRAQFCARLRVGGVGRVLIDLATALGSGELVAPRSAPDAPGDLLWMRRSRDLYSAFTSKTDFSPTPERLP